MVFWKSNQNSVNYKKSLWCLIESSIGAPQGIELDQIQELTWRKEDEELLIALVDALVYQYGGRTKYNSVFGVEEIFFKELHTRQQLAV